MSDTLPRPIELVLITGMSGSGKSVALTALEDVGFYCVDNLPPELLESFIELEQSNQAPRVAIAMDVRSAASLPGLPPRGVPGPPPRPAGSPFLGNAPPAPTFAQAGPRPAPRTDRCDRTRT